MGLIDDIGPGPIGVDTALFIYLIEEDPRFLPVVMPLFREADEGRRELVTSALTLLEVLVVPYRAGDKLLADRYEALLAGSRGIRLVDITRGQLTAAAQLRATSSVRTPDALQLVAAIGHNCKAFVTDDRRLPDIIGLRVLQLERYVTRDSVPGSHS